MNGTHDVLTAKEMELALPPLTGTEDMTAEEIFWARRCRVRCVCGWLDIGAGGGNTDDIRRVIRGVVQKIVARDTAAEIWDEMRCANSGKDRGSGYILDYIINNRTMLDDEETEIFAAYLRCMASSASVQHE